ncbi:hypothetical protein HK098_004166 [Nowakowskiella sp. JEL0407]|nr:hypothetical protein HK098_004166 [Nowakowskiella sp. JEL0407]
MNNEQNDQILPFHRKFKVLPAHKLKNIWSINLSYLEKFCPINFVNAFSNLNALGFLDLSGNHQLTFALIYRALKDVVILKLHVFDCKKLNIDDDEKFFRYSDQDPEKKSRHWNSQWKYNDQNLSGLMKQRIENSGGSVSDRLVLASSNDSKQTSFTKCRNYHQNPRYGFLICILPHLWSLNGSCVLWSQERIFWSEYFESTQGKYSTIARKSSVPSAKNRSEHNNPSSRQKWKFLSGDIGRFRNLGIQVDDFGSELVEAFENSKGAVKRTSERWSEMEISFIGKIPQNFLMSTQKDLWQFRVQCIEIYRVLTNNWTFRDHYRDRASCFTFYLFDMFDKMEVEHRFTLLFLLLATIVHPQVPNDVLESAWQNFLESFEKKGDLYHFYPPPFQWKLQLRLEYMKLLALHLSLDNLSDESEVDPEAMLSEFRIRVVSGVSNVKRLQNKYQNP